MEQADRRPPPSSDVGSFVVVLLALRYEVERRAVGVRGRWRTRRRHAIPEVHVVFRRCDSFEHRIRCSGSVAANHENAMASVVVLNAEHGEPRAEVGWTADIIGSGWKRPGRLFPA